MTSTLGLTPFHGALALEIFANIISLPSLILNPDHALSMLTPTLTIYIPTTRSLIQWFGGMVAFLTVPLIMSWPNPKSGPAGDVQRGFRRATYITMGSGEAVLLAVLGAQWVKGDSGLKDGALMFLMANMAALFAMRGVFLFWKKEWLDGSDEASKKAQ